MEDCAPGLPAAECPDDQPSSGDVDSDVSSSQLNQSGDSSSAGTSSTLGAAHGIVVQKDGVYYCRDCSYSHRSSQCLRKHALHHLLSGREKCPRCSYSAATKSRVSLHVRKHHSDFDADAWQRKACGKDDESSAGLSDDIRISESDRTLQIGIDDKSSAGLSDDIRISESDRTLQIVASQATHVNQCSACGIGCSSADDLRIHYLSVHPEHGLLSCSACPMKFLSSSGRTRHFLTKHKYAGKNKKICQGTKALKSSPGVSQTDGVSGCRAAGDVKVVTSLTCDHCSFSVASQELLDQHVKSEHSTTGDSAAEDNTELCQVVNVEEGTVTKICSVSSSGVADAELCTVINVEEGTVTSIHGSFSDEEGPSVLSPSSNMPGQVADKKEVVEWVSSVSGGLLVDQALQSSLSSDSLVSGPTCVRNEESNLWECTECSYGSKFKNSVVCHLPMHGAPRYACRCCGLRSKYKCNLVAHCRRIHNGKGGSDQIIDLGNAIQCQQASVSTPANMRKNELMVGKRGSGAKTGAYSSEDKINYPPGTIFTDKTCTETKVYKMDENCSKFYRRDATNAFACLQCNYINHNLCKLLRHVETHSDINRFVCMYCDMRASNYWTTRLHVAAKHASRQIRVAVLPRPQCPLVDSDASAVNSENRCMVDNQGAQVETAASNSVRKRHYPAGTFFTDETYTLSMIYKIDESCSKLYRRAGPRAYACVQCSFTNRQFLFVLRHAEVHSAAKRFACMYCDLRSSNYWTMRLHVAAKHAGRQIRIAVLPRSQSALVGSDASLLSRENSSSASKVRRCEKTILSRASISEPSVSSEGNNATEESEVNTRIGVLAESKAPKLPVHSALYSRRYSGAFLQYKCSRCSARFDSSAGVLRHARKHAGKVRVVKLSLEHAKASINAYVNSKLMRKVIPNLQYGCNKCSFETKSYQDILSHVRIEHEANDAAALQEDLKEVSASDSAELASLSAKTSHAERTMKTNSENSSDHGYSSNSFKRAQVDHTSSRSSSWSGLDASQTSPSKSSAAADQRHLKVTHRGSSAAQKLTSSVQFKAVYKRYPCSICPFRAERNEALMVHMALHTQRDDCKFRCTLCPYFVNNFSFLKRHMLMHQRAQQLKNCGGVLLSNTSSTTTTGRSESDLSEVTTDGALKDGPTVLIKSHSAENKIMTVTGAAAVTCSSALSESRVVDALTEDQGLPDGCESKVRHRATKTSGNDQPTAASQPVSTDELRQQNVQKTSADALDGFEEPQSLRQHVSSLQYCCEKCPYRTVQVFQLTRHTMLHGAKLRYECEFCDYSVNTFYLLLRHKRLHLRPNKNLRLLQTLGSVGSLPLIDKSGTAADAARLLQDDGLYENSVNFIHPSAHVFRCDRCPFTSSRRDRLVVHYRAHVLRSPFVCPLCDYSAGTLSVVTRHSLCHINLPGSERNPLPPLDSLSSLSGLQADLRRLCESSVDVASDNPEQEKNGTRSFRPSLFDALTAAVCVDDVTAAVCVESVDDEDGRTCRYCDIICESSASCRKHESLHTASSSYFVHE